MNPFVLVAGFAGVGRALRLVDDFFDDENNKPRKFNHKGKDKLYLFLAVLAACVMVLLSVVDARAMALVAGTVLGNLIAGKVDALPFKASGLTYFAFVIAVYSPQQILQHLPLIAAIAFLAWLDEKMENEKKMLEWKKKFGLHEGMRPFLKIGAIALALFGYLGWEHALALLAFDWAGSF